MEKHSPQDLFEDLKETVALLGPDDDTPERFIEDVRSYVECSADIYLLQLVKPLYRRALKYRLTRGENIAQAIVYLTDLVELSELAGIDLQPVLSPD